MSGEVVLRFFKGKKGNVISRLSSGKIALINRNYRGTMPRPSEKWICRIDFEKESFAVITPIARIIKKPVYEIYQYKCGHSKKVRLYDKEMPENEEPEIRVTKLPEICDKCKENCKHENIETEIDLWDFGLLVRKVCRYCRKIIEEIDFSDVIDENRGFFGTDFNKVREAVKQRINDPEIQKKVLEEINREENYIREHREYLRKEKKLKKEIMELRVKIIKLIGIGDNIEQLTWLGDYEIDTKQGYLWYWTSIKGEPDELYTPVRHHIEIPDNVKEQVYRIWNRVQELEKELRRVVNWLVENRPVE